MYPRGVDSPTTNSNEKTNAKNEIILMISWEHQNAAMAPMKSLVASMREIRKTRKSISKHSFLVSLDASFSFNGGVDIIYKNQKKETDTRES